MLLLTGACAARCFVVCVRAYGSMSATTRRLMDALRASAATERR